MDSVTGQVPLLKFTEKWLDFVKKTKEEKQKSQNQRAFLKEMVAAKAELDLLRHNLNFVTDEGTKEYCIFRLKAAELNYNRYIKLAKKARMTQLPRLEEPV